MGAAETAEHVASRIVGAQTWLAEHLVGKRVVSAVKSVWSAEYAWAKRHPTITSIGAGAVGALVGGVFAAFLLGAAALTIAGVLAVGAVAGIVGGLAQYLANVHLTDERFSWWELLRVVALSGGIGLLTAGLAGVAAKAFGPLAAQLFASPATRKAVVAAASEAGANGAVNVTVAANQKVMENLAKNYGEGKSLLSGVTDGVPTEIAKNVAVAGGSAIASQGLPAVAGAARNAARRALPSAPEVPLLPGSAPPRVPASAPEAPRVPAPSVPEPPRRGIVQALDEGAPLGPASASAATPSKPTAPSEPVAPVPETASSESVGPKKSDAARALGGENDTARSWSNGKPGDPVANANEHWNKHRAEFPELKDAQDYMSAARSFRDSPPAGTQVKVRANGEKVLWDPRTDRFAVYEPDGTPKTFFKPDPAKHGYATNQDYFHAQ